MIPDIDHKLHWLTQHWIKHRPGRRLLHVPYTLDISNFFCQTYKAGCNHRTRGNCFRLCQEKFRLFTGKNFFTEKGGEASQGVVESPSLKVSKEWLNKALRYSGSIEEVEISQRLDSVILEGFTNLNNFMFYDSTGLTSKHVHCHTHVCSQSTSQCCSCWIFRRVSRYIEYLLLYKRVKYRLMEILLY